MQKKLLVPLFIFVLTAGVSFSQSYLNLSLYDDSEFSLVFDGNELSSGNYAEFDNVPAGEHSLKITKYDPSILQKHMVVFDGTIKIPAGYDIYAVIDEYNTFNIYKKKGYGYNRYIYSGEFLKKCGDKGNYKNKEQYTDECKNKQMKKDDYGDLKGSINNRNFETTNVDVLKSAIDKNYLSSEQLKELLGFFTFESNKIDIAKYAYKKVCDKQNFFKVYEAFDFDASVTELKNYISDK